jgi:hypothetical protein
MHIPAILALPSGQILVGTEYGVQRSIDRGMTWSRANVGLGLALVSDFSIAPSGDYYVASGEGIHRSFDRGQSWVKITNDLPSTPYQHVHVTRGGVILATRDDGLFRSSDYGEHWAGSSSGLLSGRIDAIASLPSGTLVASQSSKVYRSTNNGDSWTPMFAGAVGSFSVDSPRYVYAVEDSRVRRSSDDGQSWIEYSRDVSAGGMLSVNAVGHLFTANSLGIYRSVDGCQRWALVESHKDYRPGRLAVGPNGYVYNLHNVYSGVEWFGLIRRSTDNGRSWSDVSDSLNSQIINIVTDPAGFFICVSSIFGISRSIETTSPKEIPGIFVDPVLDLGRKRISKWHDSTLTVANVGNAPLQVVVASSDTSFHVRDTEFTIPAGTIYQDSLEFKLAGLGQKQSDIVLSHNAGARAESVAVRVVGFGYPILRMLPDTAFFGDVYVSQYKDTAVTFFNDGDDTLRVASVRAASQAFTARGLPYPPIPPAGGAVNVFRFTPQSVGAAAGEIYFTSNTESGLDTLGLLGTGKRVALMQLQPAALDFGKVQLAKAINKTFTVTNVGTDTLVLFKTTTEDPAFSGPSDTVSVLPGHQVQRIATYSPTRFGRDSTTLTVHNTSLTPAARITLVGSSPKPSVHLLSTEIDIGEVMLESTKTAVLSITNSSINSAMIDSIHFHPERLAIDTTKFIVQPWTTSNVAVRVTPHEHGIFLDTLWIYSNTTTPVLVVSLYGNCSTPRLEAIQGEFVLNPVALGDSTSKTLTLYARFSALPITVDSLLHGLNMFSVDRSTPFVIAGGDSALIPIGFSAKSLPAGFGSYKDTLHVFSNAGNVDVAMVGSSPLPLITLTPLYMDFSSKPFNDSTSTTAAITNESVNTLVIDTIYSRTQCFSSSKTRGTVAMRDTFEFTIRAYGIGYGVHLDTMFLGNNSATPVLKMGLRLTVPLPSPAFNPWVLPFGNVLPGTTKEMQIKLTNSSISALLVDSLWTGSTYFKVVSGTQRTPIGRTDTAKITVGFTPDGLHSFSDTLNLRYNSLPSVLRVQLTGSGSNAADVATVDGGLPKEVSLIQNYPNPFNPSTTIRYGLPNRSHVLLTVYNTLGQQIAVLRDAEQEAGYHEVEFDGSMLSSGVYFYRMQAGGFVQTKRLLILR